MKLVPIFDNPKPTLYAIQYNDDEQDEFDRLFGLWNNPQYLRDFFNANKSDLNGYYSIDLNEAIRETYKQAKQLENDILNCCKKGHEEITSSLQTMFIPLNNNDTSISTELQKTKSRRRWLRIYAIRVDVNLFVVTGGAIKLTRNMQDRDHTREELGKIDRVVDFLREEGLITSDDFETLEL